MFTCYWDIIGLYSPRCEQPHKITKKRHGCGFSYSLDQGTTEDMPIHIEPLAKPPNASRFPPISTRVFP